LNLIYNEYLQFLKDNGVDTDKYNLCEGYYWLDNTIIKAYDSNGKLHKILRVHTDDDLNVITTEYAKKKAFPKFESWQETLERFKQQGCELF
jgi:hypothetical protein